MNAGTGLTGNELYPRFSDAEYDRRYQAVREAMLQDNLDAILISGARGSSEVHYLSNYLAQYGRRPRARLTVSSETWTPNSLCPPSSRARPGKGRRNSRNR
jgi:hypothetical protein